MRKLRLFVSECRELRWIKEENRSEGLWMERTYKDLRMESDTDHKLVASLQMQGRDPKGCQVGGEVVM